MALCAAKAMKFLVENQNGEKMLEKEEAVSSIKFFSTQMTLYKERCELMIKELKFCRTTFTEAMVFLHVLAKLY